MPNTSVQFFVQQTVVFQSTGAGSNSKDTGATANPQEAGNSARPHWSSVQLALGISREVDPESGMTVNLSEFSQFFASVTKETEKKIYKNASELLVSLKKTALDFCRKEKCEFQKLLLREEGNCCSYKLILADQLKSQQPLLTAQSQFQILWATEGKLEKRRVEIEFEFSDRSIIEFASYSSESFQEISELKAAIELKNQIRVLSVELFEMNKAYRTQFFFD